MSDTLASKIAKASIEVGSLAADKRNKEQNYDYLSADQILQKAGDALSKNGVVIIPSITSTEIKMVDRGQGKPPRLDAQVLFSMTVTDGQEKHESEWVGFGTDYSTPDKAVYKAITSGHKYFEMKLLNIGIGNEDGEHENGEQERKQSKPAQSSPVRNQAPVAKVSNEIITAAEWEAFGQLAQKAQSIGVKLPDYDRSKMTPATLNGAKNYINQEMAKVTK